ncbi:polyribonucleotide nucleotidyltransferase [Candidatus Falkowbacteria bacterium]|nr:MAG: polyribonucleotide nucleotidyltransferase [Candidatus Falkowbacteria bacterium]
MNNEQVFSTEWLGRELTMKTGLLAKQANAAVTVQYGDTVVLATAVESKNEREGLDYFPLMVDFEEKFYAAGMIKGSRWIKREGRPTDDAILTGRMIDRTIRPLFAGNSRKDVQVILTVLSVDQKNDHDIVGLVAASAALTLSGIEWRGPIGGIPVGRIDNKFIFNPTYEERKMSDLDLIVAGTEKKIIMIEAGGKEIKEDDMHEAFLVGQKELQTGISLIKEMVKKVGIKKGSKKNILINEEEKESNKEKEKIVALANDWLSDNVNKILFDKSYYTKGERKLAVGAIKDGLDAYLFDKNIGKDHRKFAIKETVDKAVDAEVTKEIIENERRVDGRKLTEIRTLTSSVKTLPRLHGTGLFSRGETQVLSIVTLGAPGLAQTLEGIEGNGEKRFMHHYNFPPFSVGEARFMRGPGRRDIGHGALAEKALEPLIPSKEDFPYALRVVSETLGSNGSSSMGSTCALSLSLMDAGVPIKKPVAGVAIGLASNDDMSKWKVLTDIQYLEDGKCGMDFKVAGTKDGITAIQLDTKTDGLTPDILKTALKQGLDGRLKILNVMNKAIDKPRDELSPFAPRVVTFIIDTEKIRDVIGPGGKIINAIIAECDVAIDIEDDGSVFITSVDETGMEKAVNWVKDLTREFEAGEIFDGKVVRILDFGAFVELAPGRDGMVHVSELAPYRISKPSDFVDVGDEVKVKIKEIDDQGRVNLTMVGLDDNEKLWKDKKGMEKGGFERNGGRFSSPRTGGFNRGGPRNDRRGPRKPY